jgi:hypothetical protein
VTRARHVDSLSLYVGTSKFFERCVLPRVSYISIAQRRVVSSFARLSSTLFSICTTLRAQRQTTNRSPSIQSDFQIRIFRGTRHTPAQRRIQSSVAHLGTDAVSRLSTLTTQPFLDPQTNSITINNIENVNTLSSAPQRPSTSLANPTLNLTLHHPRRNTITPQQPSTPQKRSPQLPRPQQIPLLRPKRRDGQRFQQHANRSRCATAWTRRRSRIRANESHESIWPNKSRQE